MVSICKYSTLIFAGNVTVLLIVSMCTDYWEYRGFDIDNLNKTLRMSNATTVTIPKDTRSYIKIHHGRTKRVWNPSVVYPFNITMYQPPILVHKYYNMNFSNVPLNSIENISKAAETVIILFVQYGNLFRDCDNLEEGVRERLGILRLNPRRCYSFLSSTPRDGAINIPAARYLERGAFSFALICLLSMMSTCVTGAYGSFCRSKDCLMASSATSLAAGMCLTFAIALFHGKCHILRRRELVLGHDVPFKELINEGRTYDYGWSFVLAWICVALCFISSFIWLHKSQYLGYSKKSREDYMFPGRLRRNVQFAYREGFDE